MPDSGFVGPIHACDRPPRKPTPGPQPPLPRPDNSSIGGETRLSAPGRLPPDDCVTFRHEHFSNPYPIERFSLPDQLWAARYGRRPHSPLPREGGCLPPLEPRSGLVFQNPNEKAVESVVLEASLPGKKFPANMAGARPQSSRVVTRGGHAILCLVQPRNKWANASA